MILEIRLNLNITINLETLLLTWNLTRKNNRILNDRKLKCFLGHFILPRVTVSKIMTVLM